MSSRRRLWSMLHRIWRRLRPVCTSPSPVRLPTFVVITTSERRPFSARPSIASDSPPAYASAVSKKFTPASSARATIALASASSVL
nr:hypothetical protein [Puia dinghuensis]